ASTGSDGTSAGAFVSGVADAAAGAGLGAALRVHAPPQIATAAKHSASAEWRTDLSEQPTLSMDCTLMTAHRLGEIRGPFKQTHRQPQPNLREPERSVREVRRYL